MTVVVPTTANSLLPPDEQCTDAIMSNPRWVCLTAAVVADGRLTVQYVSDGAAMSIRRWSASAHLRRRRCEPV